MFVETFFLALSSSAIFPLQNRLSDCLLFCFAWEIKSFYRSSVENEIDFTDKMRYVCRWKSNDNSDINIFMLLKNHCNFLLEKEKTWRRIFNANSELSQNRTEKQIMLFKTTVNWLFNDIQWKLPIADILNTGHTMSSGQNI